MSWLLQPDRTILFIENTNYFFKNYDNPTWIENINS